MLDPFSLISNTMYGQFLYHAGQLEESIQQLRATLDMEWRFWIAHICLAKSYEQQGMYSDALAACEAAGEFSGGNSETLSLAGYVHAVSGEKAKAEAKIQQLLELNLHSDALTDDCWFMTTISWGISRQKPKSHFFVRNKMLALPLLASFPH